MRLIPKTIDFFEIFDKISSNISNAASLLVSLMENFDNLEARAKEIHELEQDGDILTHGIMKKLNKTFITPIDREDLYALASKLDDILDLIWAAVDRLTVFKLNESTKEETRQIPSAGSSSDQTRPGISGNYIVWGDTRNRNPYTDIYLFDLSDGSEECLSMGSPGSKLMPAVSHDRIVWEDSRSIFYVGYNTDIYMLTLGPPETCPGADFTADHLVDPPSGQVIFSDSSSGGTSPITYRLWNFSYGSALGK